VPDDYVSLDRAAVTASADLVRRIGPGDWSRPTPCAGWDLSELVAHMAVQHHGFAAASEGAGTDLDPWQPVKADDPIAAYEQAAERVIAAFAAPGVLEREMWLPEISTQIRFAAPVAISFHYLDYVVHSWDVARSLDVPVPLGDDVIEPVLALAGRVPDDERRRQPGAAFQPPVEDTGGSTLDRILAMLGRSPDWKAP
jgi:uncharacterized protein (TIGR03086 family)